MLAIVVASLLSAPDRIDHPPPNAPFAAAPLRDLLHFQEEVPWGHADQPPPNPDDAKLFSKHSMLFGGQKGDVPLLVGRKTGARCW